MYFPRYEENDEIYYIEDFQWRLDIPKWELTDNQKFLLQCADALQDGAMSTRQVARNYGIAKSTLLDFIHGECKSICSELSGLCIRQLKWNRENHESFKPWPRKNYKHR